MLWHAEWAGRERLEGARVLDAFAGTGALGIEALSRGAAQATFFETDRAALAALRANAAACGPAAQVLAADALKPPRAPAPCTLIFLDPPYAQGLIPRAVAALDAAGWLAADALIVAEQGRGETTDLAPFTRLAQRDQGAGAVSVWRQHDRGR